jgi:hypothetical protein
MYFEVLPDYKIAEYGYASRTKGAVIPWNGRPSTPMTCPIFTKPKKGMKKTIKLPIEWQKLLRDVNSASAYSYIIKKAQGWFNQPFPRCETLAMGSGEEPEKKNYVKGEYWNKDFIKISTFRTTDSPPAASSARDNYPYLFHRFTIINKNNRVYDGRPGGVYIYLISDVDMFIPVQRVIRV